MIWLINYLYISLELTLRRIAKIIMISECYPRYYSYSFLKILNEKIKQFLLHFTDFEKRKQVLNFYYNVCYNYNLLLDVLIQKIFFYSKAGNCRLVPYKFYRVLNEYFLFLSYVLYYIVHVIHSCLFFFLRINTIILYLIFSNDKVYLKILIKFYALKIIFIETRTQKLVLLIVCIQNVYQ